MTVRPTSVIICTHNRADLLPRIVGQIRAQDYSTAAFEIIVVDHLSTDHTAQVVKRLALEPGAPVRYVPESHPGVTCARNRGAEEARNPYLAFIDDDCSVGPEWLLQLMLGFDLHERVLAVGGKVVLNWDQQEKPTWVGPELEPWLAGNSHLGTQSRLFEKEARIIECNMALTRSAWQACGGFLGMEQFGSQHFAASEVLYMLKQIERQGGKIAYVPKAVVHHHVGKRSQRWMLRRAYWQGVSDGVLDYLLYRRPWATMGRRVILDSAAMIILFGYAVFSFLKTDKASVLVQREME